MARMEELSHCVALSERQAKALLSLISLGNKIGARPSMGADEQGDYELLTHDEMRDLQARIELALREDER